MVVPVAIPTNGLVKTADQASNTSPPGGPRAERSSRPTSSSGSSRPNRGYMYTLGTQGHPEVVAALRQAGFDVYVYRIL